ncbi:SpoIIE family protein phosphatase [Edaphobacter bradus]|uniref:SpoIIE family protein phosphatase n=1 Tax=Edaphobacter bradus TaxID=2259016 RepID=UPI0021E0AFFB|nr:SpoIIE family protein phosphatase [Edaphobacter bradus]
MELSQLPVRLVIHEGENSRTVNIDTVPFTIGRQPGSNLFLSNTQVSRQHAVLHRDEDGYFLQDLGSRHGTLINGIRRETARLQSGDRIQLGLSNITLVFLTALDQRTSSTRNLLTLFSTGSSSTELEKLSLFLQAAQSFNNTRVLQDVLSTMIEYTLRLTGAERGFVFLGDSPANLTLETGLNCEGQPLVDDSKISRSILRDAAQSGQEYLIGDVSGEGQPVSRESMVAHDLRSAIAIPLRGRASTNLLGILYLDSRLHTGTLNRVGRDILHAIATEAATLVENARMVQAQRAADLLRNELEIAASIQQSIIPRELPTFPYANLMARAVQCTEVGGDFYDVIPVSSDSDGNDGFVAIVADVSGKGMPAALLAAIIHGMMYAQVKGCSSLVNAVATVNDFLCCRVFGQRYVTLIALHYRPSGQVELVNGGHVSPFLVHEDGTVEPITDGDVPVGLLHNATFHSITLTLPPKARLVLLSDGITEAEDSSGEQFGPTKLKRELATAEPVHAIFTSMHRFSGGAPPRDDCTLLVIDRTT